jgi:hypothetical protein
MLALFVLCVPALARDNGQYNNVDPEIRQWFRDQISPQTGSLCCEEADATYAEEDIRNGVYWTRFEQTKGEWIPGHLEKFFSPSRCESDSLTAMGHGRIERASHGADELFRC